MSISSARKPSEPPPSRLRRWLIPIRTNLIAGLLVAGPIGATIWILSWLYSLVDPPVQRVVLWFMGQSGDTLDVAGHALKDPGTSPHLINWVPFLPNNYIPDWLNPNIITTDPGPKYQVIFGLGLVVILMILFLVGFLTRTVFGRVLIHFTDWLLTHIPVVNTIYSPLKQLSDTIFGKRPEDADQKEVVLVEYPEKGSAAIGFLTGVTRGTLQAGALRLFNGPTTAGAGSQAGIGSGFAGSSAAPQPSIAHISAPPVLDNGGAPPFGDPGSEEMVLVFVPMSPLPTGGFLIVVPRSKVVKLDITVEQAFQLIVSGGIIQPNGANEPGKSGPRPAVAVATAATGVAAVPPAPAGPSGLKPPPHP